MMLALLALALAAPDAAEAAPPPRPRIEVVWTAAPNWRDVVNVYPKRAWSRQASGKAIMSCAVTAEGKLTDCLARSEDPKGYGFGAAALLLSTKFRLAPAHEGQAIGGGRIDVGVDFVMPPTS